MIYRELFLAGGDDSKQYRELSGKMLAIYLYFMSGTPYIYQGEEIGMTNYEISDISEVNDIESRQMYYDRLDKGYPKEEVLQSINTKGRDNARHPMQWDLSKNAGFTTATPWLAVHPNYKSINVETSLANQDSLFFTYKELIELRKNNYDIINGEYQTLNTGNPDVLAYIRYNDNEQIIVVVNFSKQSQQYSLQTNLNHSKCLIHNYNTEIDSSNELQAYEAFAVKVSRNNL